MQPDNADGRSTIQGLIGDGYRPEGWTVEQENAMLAAVPGTPPGPLFAREVTWLVAELRAMDLQQQQTDARGGAELAWHYWRGSVERLLGLDPGALDMSAYLDRFEDAERGGDDNG